MSQINPNIQYNLNPKYPNFKADKYLSSQTYPQNISDALPQSAQLSEQSFSEIELPEIYQTAADSSEPQSVKEFVKKVDMFEMVYPWLDTPLLMAGTSAAAIYGIDRFTKAWGGDYEKSLLGKANRFGDNLANAKFFEKEPVKKASKIFNKGWGKVSKAVKNNSWYKAMVETPCEPEWSMAKFESISQNRRIIQDDFFKIADNLKLADDSAISLNKLGLRKTDEDLLKRLFNVNNIKEIPEDKAVNAVLMGRLGKTDSEVLRLAEQGKNGLANVKKELLDFIGLTTKDITDIKADEADKLVSKVFDAAKKGKGKIWVGEGEISLLGKFQPLKREIGFDNVYNRMHSIADGAKTELGRGLSKFIQLVHRGFTFGGGYGGMILWIVPHLAKTVTNTIKAEPEEKLSTAVQGSIDAISWVFTMPLATNMLYAMGGLKYAGMGKDKVTTYKKLIEDFNNAAINYDKATYKTKRKALEESLKNLRKVDNQNFLTKMVRKIANVFTSDLGIIQPHKDSFGGKIAKFFKNAGNVPIRFIGFMVLSGILGGIITKTLTAIFGRAHNEENLKMQAEEKKKQKKFTKDDLNLRLLQAQQNKVLGINRPQPVDEMVIPEHATQNLNTPTNTSEEAESTPIPGQENRFKLPQENFAENEQSVKEPETQPIDSYTYIPNQNLSKEIKKTEKPNYDNYTYIPSQENVIKNMSSTQDTNKYIPSQQAAKFVKTFDNSGLQSALNRADRAEQRAIEILNGKFNGL